MNNPVFYLEKMLYAWYNEKIGGDDYAEYFHCR